MALPEPKPGLVINYAYLWRDEQQRGQDEGSKARPCVILQTGQNKAGEVSVRVLPITHSPPHESDKAVEVPQATKNRLGLDDGRSWIKTNEMNHFVWPGPDLQPIEKGNSQSVAYGHVPRGLFTKARDQTLEHVRERSLKEVRRESVEKALHSYRRNAQENEHDKGGQER